MSCAYGLCAAKGKTPLIREGSAEGSVAACRVSWLSTGMRVGGDGATGESLEDGGEGKVGGSGRD